MPLTHVLSRSRAMPSCQIFSCLDLYRVNSYVPLLAKPLTTIRSYYSHMHEVKSLPLPSDLQVGSLNLDVLHGSQIPRFPSVIHVRAHDSKKDK